MRVQYEKRQSQPSRPRVMGRRPQGRSLSVDRGCAGRVRSRETARRGGRPSSPDGEDSTCYTDKDEGVVGPTAVLELGMYRRSMRENRESPCADHSGWQSGPRSEPERGTTSMHGHGQSDSFIVPEKPTNKGPEGHSEWVEERRLTERNSLTRNKYRTQSRRLLEK